MSKDHWVSRFLLRSFAASDSEIVQVYNKKSKTHFGCSVNNLCAEQGFTTFSPDQIPPGMDGRILEKELSHWESLHTNTLKNLLQQRSIEAISPEDFWELVRFAIWLYLCNPAHRAMLRKGWSDLHLIKAKSLSGKDLDRISLKCFGLLLPHAYLRRLIESSASQEEFLQSEFLGIVLKCADSTFNLVQEKYAWSLADYKNVNLKLCTSDRPVLLGTDTLQAPVGFGTPAATLFFPLSPDLCLTGRNVGKEKRFIQSSNIVTDPRLAEMPRLLMWAKSSQFIIAANKSDLPPSGAELPSYTPSIIHSEKGVWMLER